MAELTHQNVPLHVMLDSTGGYAHFMAEVDGALIPIHSMKAGLLTDLIGTAEALSVKAPGAAEKSGSKTSDSE